MSELFECYICKTKNETLFPFPYGSLLFEWLNNIDVKITEYNLSMRLCSLHFDDDYLSDSRTELASDAVPTLFLGPGGTIKDLAKKHKINPRSCSIPGCTTNRFSGIRMYTFPVDERRKIWKDATGLGNTHKKVLQACMLHFHAMFVNNTRLDRDAVPQLGVHPTQQCVLDDLKREPSKSSENSNSCESQDQERCSEDKSPEGGKNEVKYYCSIPGCDTNNTSGFRMYGFPKDERRCTWIETVGLQETTKKNLWACVLHFDAKSVKNTRLLRSAVPIIGIHPSQNKRVGLEPPEEDEEDIEIECESVKIKEIPKTEDQESRSGITKQCSVPGCKTNNLSNLRLFSFPMDERGEVWKESVGKMNSKRKRLFACLLHFDKVHVNNTRLDRNAVPILGIHPSQLHWLEPLRRDETSGTTFVRNECNSQDTDAASFNTDSIDIEDDMYIEDVAIKDEVDIDSCGSFEFNQEPVSFDLEPQTIINSLGVTGGFLPGTSTIVRIIEKPS